MKDLEMLVCSADTFNKWREGSLVHITKFPQIDYVKPNTIMVEQEFCKPSEVLDSYAILNKDMYWTTWGYDFDHKVYDIKVVESDRTVCTVAVALRYND